MRRESVSVTGRYCYPVRVHEAADGVTVTCPDVPELITEGASRDEALARAADALATALSFYIDDGRPIPRPGRPGRQAVRFGEFARSGEAGAA